MKKVNLVEFSEFLRYAEKVLCISWNTAHKILDNDDVAMGEEPSNYSMSDIDNNVYGWSEDSIKIVKGFMEANKIKEITVING